MTHCHHFLQQTGTLFYRFKQVVARHHLLMVIVWMMDEAYLKGMFHALHLDMKRAKRHISAIMKAPNTAIFQQVHSIAQLIIYILTAATSKISVTEYRNSFNSVAEFHRVFQSNAKVTRIYRGIPLSNIYAGELSGYKEGRGF